MENRTHAWWTLVLQNTYLASLFHKSLNHYTEVDLGKLDGVERGRRALDGACGSELAGLIRTTSCSCLGPPPMDSPNTSGAWLFWVSLKGELCYQLWPVLLRVLFDLWSNSSGRSPCGSFGGSVWNSERQAAQSLTLSFVKTKYWTFAKMCEDLLLSSHPSEGWGVCCDIKRITLEIQSRVLVE